MHVLLACFTGTVLHNSAGRLACSSRHDSCVPRVACWQGTDALLCAQRSLAPQRQAHKIQQQYEPLWRGSEWHQLCMSSEHTWSPNCALVTAAAAAAAAIAATLPCLCGAGAWHVCCTACPIPCHPPHRQALDTAVSRVVRFLLFRHHEKPGVPVKRQDINDVISVSDRRHYQQQRHCCVACMNMACDGFPCESTPLGCLAGMQAGPACLGKRNVCVRTRTGAWQFLTGRATSLAHLARVSPQHVNLPQC